jgi:hypothetical protein
LNNCALTLSRLNTENRSEDQNDCKKTPYVNAEIIHSHKKF